MRDAVTRTLVVGVDPGATTGICGLIYDHDNLGPYWYDSIILQCAASDAKDLIIGVIDRHRRERYDVTLAVEQFVVGPRAGKSATAEAGRITRELIADLTGRAPMHVRPAVTVKRWATDKRLQAAGLYAPTRGRPHARDAARHALYIAVRTGVTRDPLGMFPGKV